MKLQSRLTIAAFALAACNLTAATRYVWQESPSPGPPFDTWTNAAHVIQDAVDAALAGDEIVVTNGLYATGGRAVHSTMTNRVTVDKPLTLRSVNGPTNTIIQGYQVPGTTNGDGAIRCVYLTDGASLSGFTLTRGATRAAGGHPFGDSSGGGVWCESTNAFVTNCLLTGNSAREYGGGAYGGTLNHCTLSDNSATGGAYAFGGGAAWGVLNNCLLTGNSASQGGGGAAQAALNNCMLDGNSAGEGGGTSGTTLSYCTLTRNLAYNGGGAVWSTLRNCTLTDNLASGYGGGGAFEVTLSNCKLTRNSATWGGGVAWGTLDNCTLIDNSASDSGGGASGFHADALWADATLRNCTLIGNSASHSGGGAYGCNLLNCIVYFNIATNGANYLTAWRWSEVSYSCTAPMPTNGVANITNAPLFVDYAGGNLRLQSNSPCINAGNNAYAPGAADLDGRPRIVSGTVDIGAYEYQGPGSMVSYAWLQQYGLPTDGPVDAADLDTDGHNTWQEWRCQTDPTNALSALRLLTASPAGTNVTVSWQSVAGVTYSLERSTNVAGLPPIFSPLATDISGQPGTTTFIDTNAALLAPLFYRVGVNAR